VEFSFFVPFLLFMFVGAFDWGFYSWALISTESAARAAALYTSSSSATAGDSAGACIQATAELADAPNIAANPAIMQQPQGGLLTGSATCNAAPLTVVATAVGSGPDGAASTTVSVTYQTPVLIPIPGVLGGQFSITRVVKMRVRS
jgi:Flp pilus assembly protein TadG